METLTDRKKAGLLIVLVTLAALGCYYKISPVMVASGIVALVALRSLQCFVLRPFAIFGSLRPI